MLKYKRRYIYIVCTNLNHVYWIYWTLGSVIYLNNSVAVGVPFIPHSQSLESTELLYMSGAQSKEEGSCSSSPSLSALAALRISIQYKTSVLCFSFFRGTCSSYFYWLLYTDGILCYINCMFMFIIIIINIIGHFPLVRKDSAENSFFLDGKQLRKLI